MSENSENRPLHIYRAKDGEFTLFVLSDQHSTVNRYMKQKKQQLRRSHNNNQSIIKIINELFSFQHKYVNLYVTLREPSLYKEVIRGKYSKVSQSFPETVWRLESRHTLIMLACNNNTTN